MKKPIDEKPSKNEEEYFARRDAELVKERRARLDQERMTRERSLHLNKCPACGCDLQVREHHHVKVDECVECGGIWLNKGELEMIEELDRHNSDRRGPGFIGSLLALLR